MQIASQEDIGESIKAIKWLRESSEMALQKHGKCVFISVWSRRKVLKTRKEVDSFHARKGFRGERNLKVFMG